MKRNYKLFVILILIVAIILGVYYTLFKTSKIQIITEKTIQAKAYISKDEKKLFLQCENNSMNDIDSADVFISYYDENDNLFHTDIDIINNFNRNMKYYIKENLPLDQNEVPYPLKKIVIEIRPNETIENTNTYKTFSNEIETDYSIEGNEIKLNIINHANENIEQTNLAIVYFKKNKIVEINEIFINNLLYSYEEYLSIPTIIDDSDQTSKTIEYDTIQIFVLSAITTQ